MAENTSISWATHTFNPWMGCTKVSPACDGCYAEALMDKRYGKVQWGPHGERVRTAPANWKQPLKWNRQAEKDGTRPFVFCASLADVFDNQVPAEWRRDLFDLIRATPNLVWLLLTKRPQNIIKMAEAAGGLPANAAIGTTVEDQPRANMNVTALLIAKEMTKPAFAFLSCEPLLGPIDLTRIVGGYGHATWRDALRGTSEGPPNGAPGSKGPFTCYLPKLDWVITGGETDQGGHRARPTHPEWFRSLRDQCAAAGTAYHHKQNGEWIAATEEHEFDTSLGNMGKPPAFIVATDGTVHCFDNEHAIGGIPMVKVGKKSSGRELDGVTHDAFPEVRANG